MPIYDYKCNKCGSEGRDVFKKMSEPHPQCCGEQMYQIYATKIEVWDHSLVFEHVANDPKSFPTKRSMRRFCNEQGITSHLLDA